MAQHVRRRVRKPTKKPKPPKTRKPKAPPKAKSEKSSKGSKAMFHKSNKDGWWNAASKDGRYLTFEAEDKSW